MTSFSEYQVNRVLVVVESSSDEQPAIERMKTLAASMDFEVKLVSCDYTQYLVEGYYFTEVELPNLRAEYLRERTEMLEALAQPLREAGLDVETEAVWAHPRYLAVLDQVESYQPDLVIQSVHSHGALSCLSPSNDDWQMIRHCSAPLLLVHNKEWHEHPTILAAVDPMHARAKSSALDSKIMLAGQLFERELGGQLYTVHAYGQPPLSGTYPADAEQQHQKLFSELNDEFNIAENSRRLVEELPELGIERISNELNADLIVLGSVSRSFLNDFFIGSTTEKVVRFLDCDVLAIRGD